MGWKTDQVPQQDPQGFPKYTSVGRCHIGQTDRQAAGVPFPCAVTHVPLYEQARSKRRILQIVVYVEENKTILKRSNPLCIDCLIYILYVCSTLSHTHSLFLIHFFYSIFFFQNSISSTNNNKRRNQLYSS